MNSRLKQNDKNYPSRIYCVSCCKDTSVAIQTQTRVGQEATCYYGTRDGYRSRKEKEKLYSSSSALASLSAAFQRCPVDARRSRRQHAILQLRRRRPSTERSLQNRRTSRVSVLSLGVEALGHPRPHLQPLEQIRENDVRGVDPDQLFNPSIRHRAVRLLHAVLRERHGHEDQIHGSVDILLNVADQVRLPGYEEFGNRSLRETHRGGLEDAARRGSSRDHGSILNHGQKPDHVVRCVHVHRRPVLSHDHAVAIEKDQ